LAQIAAIGVSSSGLVLTFATSTLIAICGIGRDTKRVAKVYVWIIVTLIYPALLLLWLKFQSESHVPLNSIGTYSPINTSLGLGLREVVAFSALIIGSSALARGQQRREYGLIVLGTLVFILNPWISDILSAFSAKNVSWRLAWAAPVPLLISIGLAATIGTWSWRNLQGHTLTTAALPLIGLALLLIFVFSGRCTLAPENGVTWSRPSPKLPVNYRVAKEISDKLQTMGLTGSVLSTDEIAAWLPLSSPGQKLVMPGHTYPIMLQTVLPASEFSARIQLFQAVNSGKNDLRELVGLLRHYQVQAIVTPKNVSAKDILPPDGRISNLSLKEVDSVDGKKIFKIVYRGLQ